MIACSRKKLSSLGFSTDVQHATKQVGTFMILIIMSLILLTIIFEIKRLHLGPRMYFLDVGQGDCIVITDQKNCIVIDGGGKQNKDNGENTGMTILIPFLLDKKIRKVDFLIVTHMHFDHVQGAIELINNYKVEHLILSGVWKDREDSRAVEDEQVERSNRKVAFVQNDIDKLHDELIKSAKKNNVKIDYSFKHFMIKTKNIALECMYPLRNTLFSENENNNSSVFLLNSGSFTALFTGDIESCVEDAMMMDHPLVEDQLIKNINILKVAHHGSKTSSSKAFVERIKPECCIISVGPNLYGHPNKETITTFEQLEIPMFSTQKCGMIEVEISKDLYTIRRYKGEI